MTHDKSLILLITAWIAAPFLIALILRFDKEIDAFFLLHYEATGWALLALGLGLAVVFGKNYTKHGRII